MESTGVGGKLIQTETKTTLFICSEPAKKKKKKRNKNKKKQKKTQVINEEVSLLYSTHFSKISSCFKGQSEYDQCLELTVCFLVFFCRGGGGGVSIVSWLYNLGQKP